MKERREGSQVMEMRVCYAFSTLLHVSVSLLLAARVGAISRDDFPADFIFGASTSAYQVEGAVAEDGRKPSIWDTFTHAGRMQDKSNADVAVNQYHKYKDDVKLMYKMGLKAYRFSISWSRLIPGGRGPVNPKGLQYYNNLIDELLSYGIAPHVTLYHFDLPQILEDEYAGLLSRMIIQDFTEYANVCFKEFGDRVKYWSTFNEPNLDVVGGHDVGIFPPARCSKPFGLNCSIGDSTTEPYIAAHNILLSHASAASLYKEKYQREQGGYIGMTILGFWFEPYTNSSEDIAATQRALEFHIGWFVDPLVYGNYPEAMRKIVGNRLPTFTKEESKKLKGSFDYIGLNQYCVFYLQDNPRSLDTENRDYLRDVAVKLPSTSRAFVKGFFGEELGPIPKTPWGMQKMLEYIKVKFQNPPVIIHENGYGEYNLNTYTAGKNYDDDYRVEYLKGYMESMLLSIRNGSNTRGYFIWSFLDCFEFAFGYTVRFGLYGVDLNSEQKNRYPRLSAHWYSNFLSGGQQKIIQTSLPRVNKSYVAI